MDMRRCGLQILVSIVVATMVAGCDSSPDEVDDQEEIEQTEDEYDEVDEVDEAVDKDDDTEEVDETPHRPSEELIAEGTYFGTEAMDRDDEDFDGCMGVEINDEDDLDFSLYLRGVNFHSCTVMGIAERDGDRFVYRSQSVDDCEIEIAPTDKGVEVDEKGDDLPCSDHYCGARMAIGAETYDDEYRIDEIQECSAKAP